MRCLAAAICVTAFGVALTEDKPDGKRHEVRATEGDLHQAFRRGRDGKSRNQQPEAWIKANESIAVRYPLKPGDVELFECSSDNGDVRVAYQPNEKDVCVVIRSGDFRDGGRKGAARVMWRLYDITGRKHHWAMTVNFEEASLPPPLRQIPRPVSAPLNGALRRSRPRRGAAIECGARFDIRTVGVLCPEGFR